ncbi:hypothetical protein BJ912DRAFT_1063756 [Pholiota molesta]|nr:hypothetical protein BJ912DRAFT_1063756 [Pholiota molesta]
MPQEDQPNLKDPSLSDPLASDYIQSTPLSLWLQSRISGLYEAVPPTEEADFKALYYTTFDIDASIYMNHEKVSQDTYLARLNSANFAVTHATVNWKELIDASPSSTEKEEDVKGGIISGFFVIKSSMKFRIRAGPAQRFNFNTFSAKIDHKPEAEPAGDGSRLRITELFITSIQKAAPIHFPGIPPQAAEIHHEKPTT